MTLPKNVLTRSRPARWGRKWYRDSLRPPAQVSLAAARSRRARFRGNPPGYLVIGAQKAGTTAIFESLMTMSEFGRPLLKEVHYFDIQPGRPKEWYFSHFWGDPALCWGEATPEYLDGSDVPRAVKKLLPGVKLIVSLRDPVTRAVSHYHHSVDFGYESRTLERAIRDEAATLRDGGWVDPRARTRFGYISRSLYARPMSVWFESFDPSQILVTVAERRTETLPRILRFLDIEPARLPPTSREANRREYEPPPLPVLDAIREATSDDAADLAKMLGWSQLPAEWSVR